MLSPYPAREGDLLTCTPGSAVDADGDAVSFGFSWSIAGIDEPLGSPHRPSRPTPLPGETSSPATSRRLTAPTSEPVASNPVPIENTEPSISAVTISPNPARATDPLTCTHSGFDDADDDADESIVAWTINGLSAGTGPTLDAGHRAATSSAAP